MSHFFVIDVETANASQASICQIGLVEFRDGREAWSGSWLVDPNGHFDRYNTKVHGITADRVRGAGNFAAIWPEQCARIGDTVVVSHSLFDRTAITQACARSGLVARKRPWLDSTRVVRRAWPEFAKSGYGLANVTQHLGISFRHHDALEDARAAGLILIQGLNLCGTGIEDWLAPRRSSAPSTSIARDGHDNGPLSGECIVFTGKLEIDQAQAADQAASLGATIADGVTKKTTLLVVGQRDLQPGWPSKSGKHRKAEDLIERGQPMRILGEADFQALLADA